MRILILDNDHNLVGAMAMVLEANDHQVYTAKDKVSALAAVHALRPDCILTDVTSKRIDGSELIRCIRSDPQFNAVQILTITDAGREILLADTDATGHPAPSVSTIFNLPEILVGVCAEVAV